MERFDSKAMNGKNEEALFEQFKQSKKIKYSEHSEKLLIMGEISAVE